MRVLFALLVLLVALPVAAQDAPRPLEGFKLRNAGPAFVAGRIADIAVPPNHETTWYVGTASGGVWKTKNAGITWDPLFDDKRASPAPVGTLS